MNSLSNKKVSISHKVLIVTFTGSSNTEAIAWLDMTFIETVLLGLICDTMVGQSEEFAYIYKK